MSEDHFFKKIFVKIKVQIKNFYLFIFSNYLVIVCQQIALKWIWSDLHIHTFQRVKTIFPIIPNNTILVYLSTCKILSIQVGMITPSVPPSSVMYKRTIIT